MKGKEEIALVYAEFQSSNLFKIWKMAMKIMQLFSRRLIRSVIIYWYTSDAEILIVPSELGVRLIFGATPMFPLLLAWLLFFHAEFLRSEFWIHLFIFLS